MVQEIGWGIGYALTTVVFALKIFTRLKYGGRLFSDDYVAGFAWAIISAATGVIYLMLYDGLEEPAIQWLFYPKPKVTQLLLCFFVSINLYNWGVLCTKLSLICYFFRLSSSKLIKYQLIVISGVLIASSTAWFISMFFWCSPTRAFWVPMPIPTSPDFCSLSMQHQTTYAWQTVNIATDLYLMCIPHFLIRKAALSHRALHVAMFFLFALAVLVIATSGIKVFYVARNEHPQLIVLWCFVEACVALGIACLPSLVPLIYKAQRTGSNKRGSEKLDSGTGKDVELTVRAVDA